MNYNLRRVLELARDHRLAGQHGWGVDRLFERGFDVRVAPFSEPASRQRPLARASEATKFKAGLLDQEVWALRQSPRLIYAADQTSAKGLALLGRTPVVSVLHHPPTDRRATRWTLERHTRLVALSEAVAERARAIAPTVPVDVAPWGPDLAFREYRPGQDENFVMCSGKSNRDWSTLLEAAAGLDVKFRVVSTAPAPAGVPSNVHFVGRGTLEQDDVAVGQFTASDVHALQRAASIIAVPIVDPNRLTGLTEFNDALALGKPIVATASPYHPFDVENIGCGILVPPGDVQAWRRAFEELSEPSVRAEMGARGREFAERHWNYERFCDVIESCVRGALADD